MKKHLHCYQNYSWNRGPRSGSALVLSLMAVVIVMLLAMSFSQFAASVSRASVEATDRKRAFYVAEAGLSEAYTALMLGKSGNVGNGEEPALFGDGLFWVEATESGDLVELASTGMVGGGCADLSLVAERGSDSIAKLGVYSDAQLVITPGTLIDSYDSSIGAYGHERQIHTKGQVGSNAAIVVEGTELKPTLVRGDLTPGPAQALEVLGEFVTITGSTAPAASPVALPPVETPDVELGPGRDHSSASPLLVLPGTLGIEYLIVRSNSDLIVQGPSTVVVGNLALEPSAQLTFDTSDGPIELYVLDALAFAEGSSVVTTGTEPDQVMIQAPNETAAPLTFRATSEFHGVIYAPLADVIITQSFQLFGALIGEGIRFEGSARLHFDQNLATQAAESALPSLYSWRILDLGGNATDVLTDPFRLLGVNPDALPRPGEAHEDLWLEAEYIDTSDSTQGYTGWESAFDWKVVKKLLKGKRNGKRVVIPGKVEAGLVKDPGAGSDNPDPMLEILNDPEADSSDVKDALLARCPLTEDVISTLLTRDPRLNESDVMAVLVASSPLTDNSLKMLLFHRCEIGSSKVKDILIANSPLSVDVMNAVLGMDAPLNVSDLNAVLLAQ